MESLIQSNLKKPLSQIDPLTNDELLWSLLLDVRTVHRSIKHSLKELDPRSFTVTGFSEAHYIEKSKTHELKPIEPFVNSKYTVSADPRFNQRIYQRHYFSETGELIVYTGPITIRVVEPVVFDDNPAGFVVEFDAFFPPSLDDNDVIEELQIERAIRAVASSCVIETPIYGCLSSGKPIFKDDEKAKLS